MCCLGILLRDRDFYHRKDIKTGSDHHWSRYRKLKNIVNREIKAAKSKYYCDLVHEEKGTLERSGRLLMKSLRGKLIPRALIAL